MHAVKALTIGLILTVLVTTGAEADSARGEHTLADFVNLSDTTQVLYLARLLEGLTIIPLRCTSTVTVGQVRDLLVVSAEIERRGAAAMHDYATPPSTWISRPVR
jgi:hypothetical protein